ncbi:MAG: hypothetical protein M5U08_04015 [Burkholderiales bacterium]|nr:hypothetical protein [Burkholderiales bacterium]
MGRESAHPAAAPPRLALVRLGVGFLEVIEDLHKLHVLPTLFRLY